MKLFISILLLTTFLCSKLFPDNILLNMDFPEAENIQLKLKNIKDINNIKKQIDKYLIYKGYTLASVKNIIKKSNDNLIYLDEGRLNEVKITGNFKISRTILNVYIKFKKNDIFNERTLRLQIKKLYNTGLFEKINYKVYADKKILIVKIKEKKQRCIYFSGNISSRFGVMPYAEYTERAIFNTEMSLNLSSEFGIWSKLKFQKYNIKCGIKNWTLYYLYRNGVMYYGDSDYNEEKSIVYINKIKNLTKYSLVGFKIFTETYYFYNIEKIKNENIEQGIRYGFALNFHNSNKREVIEEIREDIINLSTEIKIFSKKVIMNKSEFYFKRYFSPFLYWGIIFRNSTGYIHSKRIPFDEQFFIGGEMQRGYYDGEHTSISKFENSIEIEYEAIIDTLFLLLFCDTSLINIQSSPLFLISNGAGVRLNLFGFSATVYYGVPAKYKFTQGEFRLAVKQLLY